MSTIPCPRLHIHVVLDPVMSSELREVLDISFTSTISYTLILDSSHVCHWCITSPQVAGDPAVSSQLSKFMGVRNGIDVDIWDPSTDRSLPRRFGAEDLVEGKAACREALRQRLGLTGWGDRPLVGVVSRLTAQKGALRGLPKFWGLRPKPHLDAWGTLSE